MGAGVKDERVVEGHFEGMNLPWMRCPADRDRDPSWPISAMYRRRAQPFGRVDTGVC